MGCIIFRDKFSLMVDNNGSLDPDKFKDIYKCDPEQAKKVIIRFIPLIVQLKRAIDKSNFLLKNESV
jgi:Ca2+-binding EF-hand superfamily protein